MLMAIRDIDPATLSLDSDPEYMAACARAKAASDCRDIVTRKINRLDQMETSFIVDMSSALIERRALVEEKKTADRAYEEARAEVARVTRAVCIRLRESVREQHRRLAGEIKHAAEHLLEALRAELQFRGRLDSSGVGFGHPLQPAAIRDATARVDPWGRMCGFTLIELLERYPEEVSDYPIEEV